MLFASVGFVGSVLGQLLLSIALFRTRTGPVWVGPAIWAFLALEFFVSTVTPWASYLAVVLLGARSGRSPTCCAAARRTPASDATRRWWRVGDERPDLDATRPVHASVDGPCPARSGS